MNTALSSSGQKVQDTLLALGVQLEVTELPSSTRTAQDAANTIGCEVAQIAKSLIFKTKETSRPILVVASGVNQVDEKKVTALVGETIVRADADFVREATGFAIGGIPPVGHTKRIDTFIDEDLMEFEVIWAAAGTPNGVFQLTPVTLKEITGGSISAVKK